MPDKLRLRRFVQSTQGRDFAVGDTHRCYNKLNAAIRKVRFSLAHDQLFAVGDLVDRGLKPALRLEWLAQPWFHPVCGNHGLMAWRRALDNPLPNIDHGGQWLDSLD